MGRSKGEIGTANCVGSHSALIAIRYNRWFRKTLSDGMGRTYTGMGYLTGRRVTFNSEIKAELPESKSEDNSMSNIAAIHAREVLDSRGNPTIEAEVFLM